MNSLSVSRKHCGLMAALMLAVILVAPGSLLAAAQAHVVSVAGGASWIGASGTVDLAAEVRRNRNLILNTNDIIQTAAGGRVMLAIPGARIALGNGARIRIGDLAANGGASSGTIHLMAGSVAVEADSGQTQLKVSGPTAVAAVRGTQFIVETEGNAAQSAAADAPTQVLVGEGSVSVSARNGQEFTVQAGQKIICDVQAARQQILEEHDRVKMNIFEEFARVRDAARNAVRAQRESGRDAMEEIRRQRPQQGPMAPQPAPEPAPAPAPEE